MRPGVSFAAIAAVGLLSLGSVLGRRRWRNVRDGDAAG